MSVDSLNSEMFPTLSRSLDAHWRPVLLNPIVGSPESFVIGVVASDGRDYAIEMANELERLECLYGSDAQVLKFAVCAVQSHLEECFEQSASVSLWQLMPPLESVHFGEVREADGHTVQELARSWMSSLSSLYTLHKEQMSKIAEVLEVQPASGSGNKDRLPTLVMNAVIRKELSLVRYFDSSLAEQPKSRNRNAHVQIDYSSPRLVANFSTLQAGRIAPSVRRIKTRLWDLKIDRDRQIEEELSSHEHHELILQFPSESDPQVSGRQYRNLKSAYDELEAQADDVKLRLRAFESVEEISDHLLKVEAAA